MTPALQEDETMAGKTWTPTHRIHWTQEHTGDGLGTDLTEVMLVDGAAYTREEWDACGAAYCELTDDGRWLFGGQATPGGSAGDVWVEDLKGTTAPREPLIQIVTRLHDGIYRSHGGGQERVVAEYRYGPRNLVRALRQLRDLRHENAVAYGSIGAGQSWIRTTDGRVLADRYVCDDSPDRSHADLVAEIETWLELAST